MIEITDRELLIAMMVAFAVGCIPLLCCICMQDFAGWRIERERKRSKKQ